MSSTLLRPAHVTASYLVPCVILPPVSCIDVHGEEVTEEPCPCCLGSRKLRIIGDSGSYVVRPADQDDPRAADCPCDGTYDRWVA